jgi:hypothetical protein
LRFQDGFLGRGSRPLPAAVVPGSERARVCRLDRCEPFPKRGGFMAQLLLLVHQRCDALVELRYGSPASTRLAWHPQRTLLIGELTLSHTWVERKRLYAPPVETRLRGVLVQLPLRRFKACVDGRVALVDGRVHAVSFGCVRRRSSHASNSSADTRSCAFGSGPSLTAGRSPDAIRRRTCFVESPIQCATARTVSSRGAWTSVPIAPDYRRGSSPTV